MKSLVPSSGSTIHTRSLRRREPSSGASSLSRPSSGKRARSPSTISALASRSACVTGSSPGLRSHGQPSGVQAADERAGLARQACRQLQLPSFITSRSLRRGRWRAPPLPSWVDVVTIVARRPLSSRAWSACRRGRPRRRSARRTTSAWLGSPPQAPFRMARPACPNVHSPCKIGPVEAAELGHVGIGVQRIQVAREPIEQRLLARGRLR